MGAAIFRKNMEKPYFLFILDGEPEATGRVTEELPEAISAHVLLIRTPEARRKLSGRVAGRKNYMI